MTSGEEALAAGSRAKTLLAAMTAALCLLAVRLWSMQVAHSPQYEEDLRRQTIRRVRLPGPRGRVYDRTGQRCLAEDRPRYGLAIYLEELRQRGHWSNTVNRVCSVLDEVSGLLGRPPDITTGDVWIHIRKRLPLPLVAWRGLTQSEMGRFAEASLQLSGVDFCVEPDRVYPYRDLAAHVLGYVGRADPAATEQPFAYYLPEAEGKRGVERTLNAWLAGTAGARLLRISASGTRHGETEELAPLAGGDVMLTIDVRVQSLAERVLAGHRGAVVVLDVATGDVLAMASAPAFDANALNRDWESLRSDLARPLVNRAVSGRYPPGSPFKLVVAVAALENAQATPETRYRCPGHLQVGRDVRLRCWRESGHGELALRKAIEQSCNVYFANLACTCGYAYIYHMAAAMGLGYRSGVAIDGESRGVLPAGTRGNRLSRGQTCNVAIGQGELCVTPLQMAVLTAAIAAGGVVHKPRLVRGLRRGDATDFTLKPVVSRGLNWSPQTVQTVRAGMHDVIHAPRGTGKRAAVPGLTLAGKTGTAEYGPKSEGKKHGWMIAFAPYDRPQVAMAIIIEDAVSGGVTVGPLVKTLMQGIFRL